MAKIKDDLFWCIDRYPNSPGFGKMVTPFVIIWSQITDTGAGGEPVGFAPHKSDAEILELRDHKAGVKHALVKYMMPVLIDENEEEKEHVEFKEIEGWVSCRMLKRLGAIHGKWK